MLKGITKGIKRPPRIVLYGPPGIGKSSFGANAPAPVFVLTEDGIDNIPVDRFPKAESWPALLEYVTSIASEEHSFRTIVLDTLNGAVELAAQHICQTQFGGQWAPMKGKECFLSYGNGWSATAEECRKLLIQLDRCRERGMTVLLLAHTGVQTVKNPIEGDYQRYAPDVDKRVWQVFCAWADIVGRADYEYTIIKGQGFAKGRAVGTSSRIVHFAGSAAEEAKARVGFELPETLPLSWPDFEAELGNDSVTLAAVLDLWHLLAADEQTKTMSWLGSKRIEDADVQKLRQVLNKLRKRQADANSNTDEQKETANVA